MDKVQSIPNQSQIPKNGQASGKISNSGPSNPQNSDRLWADLGPSNPQNCGQPYIGASWGLWWPIVRYGPGWLAYTHWLASSGVFQSPIITAAFLICSYHQHSFVHFMGILNHVSFGCIMMGVFPWVWAGPYQSVNTLSMMRKVAWFWPESQRCESWSARLVVAPLMSIREIFICTNGNWFNRNCWVHRNHDGWHWLTSNYRCPLELQA